MWIAGLLRGAALLLLLASLVATVAYLTQQVIH